MGVGHQVHKSRSSMAPVHQSVAMVTLQGGREIPRGHLQCQQVVDRGLEEGGEEGAKGGEGDLRGELGVRAGK